MNLQTLIRSSREGDGEALRRLVDATYAELKRIGREQLSRARPGGLDTTALVHEAFIKLMGAGRVSASDTEHFFAIAGRAMRQLVVDELKAQRRLKRGAGQEPLPLLTSVHLIAEADGAALRVHEALGRLEEVAPQLARLVELRVFVGFSEAETAQALGVSLRSTQRKWRQARAWLAVELGDGRR